MKNTLARAALITLALTGAWIPTASASYPMGVWVHVYKVVYDNPADPTTIEVHGAIMVHNGVMGTKYPGYSDPAEGYMYYTCPAAMKATCQLEWKDIEKNIGTANSVCIGFGSDMLPPGTLRSECEAPKNPDPYQISMGVQPAFSPCAVIETFLMSKMDAGCASGSSSATTGSSTSSGTMSSSSSSTTNASSGTSGTSGSGSGTGGAGGGASSGGGKGCACEAAPGGSVGLFGLALPALAAGIALRRRAARRGAR